MGYEHSLTFAVQAQIDNYIEKRTAQAAAQLDGQQTADELLDFLMDESKLSTPGFVLRRHIQAQGLVTAKDCPDLSRNCNIPWPAAAIRSIAAELSSISYRRHGLAISTVNWQRYLTDNVSQGIQRKMIFKLAMVTGMGQQDTMDLLLSCGQGAYMARDPLELICYFCQRTPGVYTWNDVQRLLNAWKQSVLPSEHNGTKQIPTQSMTRLLHAEVDALFTTSLPAAEAEQRLLALMVENHAELTGVSQTVRAAYLELIDILARLYPSAGPTDNLHGLITRMYDAQKWSFEDLFQTPHGERYTFRGGLADEYAPQAVECMLDESLGQIALFCKRYYSRANAIQAGKKSVDRRDILLLSYFLILGYTGADQHRQESFARPVQTGSRLDGRLELLLEYLAQLNPALDLSEKQVLVIRILNELLAALGFRSLYVPAPFDRFILFSLLTERPAWTARYLLGEESEA